MGCAGASFELRTPSGTTAVTISLPGLYNVYNALAAAAMAVALEIDPATIARGLESATAVFGRGERVSVGDRELSILLIKNPAGANEVLRLLGSQVGMHDVLPVLNDRIADGRDVSWIWDADFETLAPRVRHATCSGTRAQELALRLKYAGVPTERISVEPDLAAALRRRARAWRRPAVRPAHVYGDAGAARTARARRAGRQLVVALMSEADAVIWHDLECGGYRADLPHWLALAKRRAGVVLDVGAGTGRVALALAHAGHTVIALERDAVLAARARTARRRVLAVEVHMRRCLLASRWLPRSSLAIVPMQTIHLFADRDAFLALRRAGRLCRAACSRSRCSATALSRSSSNSSRTSCRSTRCAMRARRQRCDATAAPCCSSAAAHESPRTVRRSDAIDVTRLAACDGATLAARGPGGRLRAVGEHRDRTDARTRRQRDRLPGGAGVILRVCALYPDLMNIYADRGNLLMLERRCAWRGIGWQLAREHARRRRCDDEHDLYYIGGGQDADQRRCAADLLERKADALRAAAAREAVVLGVCGGYQLLGALLPARRGDDPGCRTARRAHRSRRGARA